MFTLCYSNLMKKILLILLISFFSAGEIEDKTLLKSFFEGCVDEVVPEFDQMPGFQFEYCGCATHGVATQYTVFELNLFSISLRDLSEVKGNLLKTLPFLGFKTKTPPSLKHSKGVLR